MPNERDLTALQLSQLSAPLNPARVVRMKKGGRGPELSYLEAWEIRTNLIRIFGYGGFSEASHVEVVQLENDVPNRSGGGTQFRATVIAHVTVTIHQLGISLQEAAAASQNNPDPGEALDFAVKTAESDAFKRAVINLGTQFGLSLYNKGDTQDVVKIVREPRQAAILKRLKAGEKPSAIDAELNAKGVDVDEPHDERTGEPSANEGGTNEGYIAPGEDPRDDLPVAEAMAAPVPSAASRATALDAVRGGFDRNGRS